MFFLLPLKILEMFHLHLGRIFTTLWPVRLWKRWWRTFQAIAARDAMAKCLYGSLFDWIVMQLNHALLAKKDADKMQRAYSIGVLDIFGFEDFGNANR